MSISSNGSVLAVGGPYDNGEVGATWIFLYNGSTYQQLGQKLVGTGSSLISVQGKGGVKKMKVYQIVNNDFGFRFFR